MRSKYRSYSQPIASGSPVRAISTHECSSSGCATAKPRKDCGCHACEGHNKCPVWLLYTRCGPTLEIQSLRSGYATNEQDRTRAPHGPHSAPLQEESMLTSITNQVGKRIGLCKSNI